MELSYRMLIPCLILFYDKEKRDMEKYCVLQQKYFNKDNAVLTNMRSNFSMTSCTDILLMTSCAGGSPEEPFVPSSVVEGNLPPGGNVVAAFCFLSFLSFPILKDN